jgi:DNA helicase-2/ATP-dependent DNA helicase PcrA
MLVNVNSVPIASTTKNRIIEFNNLISKIKEKIKTQKPSEIIEIIVKAIWYEEYLIKEYWQDDAQERMANIGQLMNVALSFNKTWTEWLRDFIDEISLFIDLEEKQQEQVDQVQLMTVHASKWLEFDTVFLVWMEENIFPLSRARLNPKELEEERRLAYVGITRAKNNLFLTYAESRKQYGQLKYNPVSRFVEEIPEYLTVSFNSPTVSKQAPSFQIWDRVKHKLFWVVEVLEVFQDSVIVRFYGHGIRKILSKMLEKYE